jgi:hypothetical protein
MACSQLPLPVSNFDHFHKLQDFSDQGHKFWTNEYEKHVLHCLKPHYLGSTLDNV